MQRMKGSIWDSWLGFPLSHLLDWRPGVSYLGLGVEFGDLVFAVVEGRVTWDYLVYMTDSEILKSFLSVHPDTENYPYHVFNIYFLILYFTHWSFII